MSGAWAVFNHLGIDGYKRIASELMGFIDDFKARVLEIPGMRIIGDPHLSIVAYTSDDVDIFRVAELMAGKGYLPGLLQKPRALHRMMSLVHAPVVDDYIGELRAAVDALRTNPGEQAIIKATY